MNAHVLELLRSQVFLHVRLVFRRKNHVHWTPARLAARTFSFTPPIGRTLPLSVISPVIAVSGRTGRPVSNETSAVAMVTPAEGPSFGIAPAGT